MKHHKELDIFGNTISPRECESCGAAGGHYRDCLTLGVSRNSSPMRLIVPLLQETPCSECHNLYAHNCGCSKDTTR